MIVSAVLLCSLSQPGIFFSSLDVGVSEHISVVSPGSRDGEVSATSSSVVESVRTISSSEIQSLIKRVKSNAHRAAIRVVDLPAEFDPERLVQKYPECAEWQWSNEYKVELS